MKKFVKWLAAAGALTLVIALCLVSGCHNNNRTDGSLNEGVYLQDIEELAIAEPVRTFLEIRDRLSENDIPAASDQVTDPSVFSQQMSRMRREMGLATFQHFFAQVRKTLTVHSIHYDGNQALLVVDANGERQSVYFEQRDDEYFEIVDDENSQISEELVRQFHQAKGNPEPKLAKATE